MRRVLRHRVLLGCFALAGLLVLAAPLPAQVITGEIDLDDNDPANTPDSPFGGILSPDGRFVIVCIAGDPDFSPDPPDLNNNEVRVIDRATRAVVNTITTGFFPVDCAATVHGTTVHLWVSNSSDGTVSVFRVENGDFDDPGSITEEPFSPIDTGAFSFPNGIVATGDHDTVWVGTTGGTGDVFALDADPQSGTFGSIADTVVVNGGAGRMALYGDLLVIPHTFFAFPLSQGRATIVDTTDTADATELVLTPSLDFEAGEFVSMVDVAVTSDGLAYLTLLGPGTGQDLVVLDVEGRTLSHTVRLEGVSSEEQHGIAIAPGERHAVVTNFASHEIATLDLRDESVVSILVSPSNEPNEVIFAMDGCTAYVTNQDADGVLGDSVAIVERFPDRALLLEGTTTPPIGATIELVVRGGCEGRKGGILVSDGNAGGAFRGIPVPISNPIQVVEGGSYDVAGTLVASPVPVPNDPGLVGKPMYYLAGAKDPGGTVRLSNVHTVIVQP